MKFKAPTAKLPLIIGALLMPGLNSCIFTPDEEEHIYSFHYYAEFHRDYDKTVGGYVIEEDGVWNMTLGYDESITVNNNSGHYSNEYDYIESYEFEGIIPKLDFLYTNPQGKKYLNVVHITDIDSILVPDLPDEIGHGDFELTWVGKPLQEGERIELTIGNTIHNLYTDFTETVGAVSFTVPSDMMYFGYYHDTIDITLKRIKMIPFPNPDSEGDFTIYYISPVEYVYIN